MIVENNQLYERIFSLCQDYKNRSDFINKKRNVYLIRKKLNKRKKYKTNSNETYYKNELKNLLNNEKIFGGTNDEINTNIGVFFSMSKTNNK